MIRHQIKTIEQAAELYQELVAIAEPSSGHAPRSHIQASDYMIEFIAERDEIWVVRIVVQWGERTDTGFTEIHAEVKPHYYSSPKYLRKFQCNREAIFDELGLLSNETPYIH